MRRIIVAVAFVAVVHGKASATGILIPVEKKLPPLAMLNHTVNIAIDDQVAITNIEQTFRNHTDRQLEATYVFPVPKGASVRRFSMWIDGKEVPGELVEADKARKIYTDIVHRTQDPGLLEYMGNDLLRLRVFPVPAKGDQKIKVVYSSIAQSDNGLVEYRYPLKIDGKATKTLEKFAINMTLRSQHSLQSIYSPTHAITVARPNEREAMVGFEKEQAVLDRDFQLFYTSGTKDVGLTAITHRPYTDKNGYFMFLVSPRAELAKDQQVPRDFLFVMDTSGSMRGPRMKQAQNALKYCLNSLTSNDRFTMINFATTVNRYTDQLMPATPEQLLHARKWVDNLEATGGTAINDALLAALDLRPNDPTRTFTLVFFTDGRPTIGETNFEKILKNVAAKNSANTRIFTFGVGDDVNASMLDRLAEESRAVVTYVREAEDIEAKVSSLYAKISNPVLANLKLTVSDTISLNEVYPPQLPDLFHGSQLIVLGRFQGDGHAVVKLNGQVGKETKEFVYELTFPERTMEEKGFIEDLWARRKVGYLLDQIRLNGEKKELVDEVVTLAKRYGITTPYTSYLIVPDAAVPVVRRKGAEGKPDVSFNLGTTGLAPGLQNAPGNAPTPVLEFIQKTQTSGGYAGGARMKLADSDLKRLPEKEAKDNREVWALQQARDRFYANNAANVAMKAGRQLEVQAGKLGVELSCDSNALRNQTQLTQTATRWVGTRNCLEVGGVWIDEAYRPDMKAVTVKAMSEAYFRLLERQPTLRNVLRLGNHLVWVTPSGTALVVDMSNGVERLTDAEIDALFVAKK